MAQRRLKPSFLPCCHRRLLTAPSPKVSSRSWTKSLDELEEVGHSVSGRIFALMVHKDVESPSVHSCSGGLNNQPTKVGFGTWSPPTGTLQGCTCTYKVSRTYIPYFSIYMYFCLEHMYMYTVLQMLCNVLQSLCNTHPVMSGQHSKEQSTVACSHGVF